jgi:hypothetical protein
MYRICGTTGGTTTGGTTDGTTTGGTTDGTTGGTTTGGTGTPVNCVGSWVETTACSPLTGNLIQTYRVTTEELNGGTCENKNKTRNVPCDVSCQGTWGPWGECDPVTRKQTSVYQSTQPNVWGKGTPCPTPRTQDCVPIMSKEWYIAEITKKCTSYPLPLLQSKTRDELSAIYSSVNTCTLSSTDLTWVKNQIPTTGTICGLTGMKDTLTTQETLLNVYNDMCQDASLLPQGSKDLILNSVITKCSKYPADFIRTLSLPRLYEIAKLPVCPDPRWFTLFEFNWFKNQGVSKYPTGFFNISFTNDDIFEMYKNEWKIRDWTLWTSQEVQFWKGQFKLRCTTDPHELIDTYERFKLYNLITGVWPCGFRSTASTSEQGMGESEYNYWVNKFMTEKTYGTDDDRNVIYNFLEEQGKTAEGVYTGSEILKVAYGQRTPWSPRPADNRPYWLPAPERELWWNMLWKKRPIYPYDIYIHRFTLFNDALIINAIRTQNYTLYDRVKDVSTWNTVTTDYWSNEYGKVCNGSRTTDKQLMYDTVMRIRSCGGGAPTETNSDYVKSKCGSTLYSDQLFNTYTYTDEHKTTAATLIRNNNGSCTKPLFLTTGEQMYWKDRARVKCGDVPMTNDEAYAMVVGSCKTNAPPWSESDFNYWVNEATKICDIVTNKWTQDEVYKVITENKCILREPSKWSVDEVNWWRSAYNYTCAFNPYKSNYDNQKIYTLLKERKCSDPSSWSQEEKSAWTEYIIDKGCTTRQLIEANPGKWTAEKIYQTARAEACPADDPNSWNSAELDIWRSNVRNTCGYDKPNDQNWVWPDAIAPLSKDQLYRIATSGNCPTQRPSGGEYWFRDFWKGRARGNCPANWDSNGEFIGWSDESQAVVRLDDNRMYESGKFDSSCPRFAGGGASGTPTVQNTYAIILTNIRWFETRPYMFDLQDSDKNSHLLAYLLKRFGFYKIRNTRKLDGTNVQWYDDEHKFADTFFVPDTDGKPMYDRLTVISNDTLNLEPNCVAEFVVYTPSWTVFVSTMLALTSGAIEEITLAQICALIRQYTVNSQIFTLPSICDSTIPVLKPQSEPEAFVNPPAPPNIPVPTFHGSYKCSFIPGYKNDQFNIYYTFRADGTGEICHGRNPGELNKNNFTYTFDRVTNNLNINTQTSNPAWPTTPFWTEETTFNENKRRPAPSRFVLEDEIYHNEIIAIATVDNIEERYICIRSDVPCGPVVEELTDYSIPAQDIPTNTTCNVIDTSRGSGELYDLCGTKWNEPGDGKITVSSTPAFGWSPFAPEVIGIGIGVSAALAAIISATIYRFNKNVNRIPDIIHSGIRPTVPSSSYKPLVSIFGPNMPSSPYISKPGSNYDLVHSNPLFDQSINGSFRDGLPVRVSEATFRRPLSGTSSSKTAMSLFEILGRIDKVPALNMNKFPAAGELAWDSLRRSFLAKSVGKTSVAKTIAQQVIAIGFPVYGPVKGIPVTESVTGAAKLSKQAAVLSRQSGMTITESIDAIRIATAANITSKAISATKAATILKHAAVIGRLGRGVLGDPVIIGGLILLFVTKTTGAKPYVQNSAIPSSTKMWLNIAVAFVSFDPNTFDKAVVSAAQSSQIGGFFNMFN